MTFLSDLRRSLSAEDDRVLFEEAGCFRQWCALSLLMMRGKTGKKEDKL